jgi:hypothetical protein
VRERITVKLLDVARELSETAIATAKVVDKIAKASINQILLGGGAALGVAAVVAVIQISGLFGKPGKSVNQVILEQLQAIREQLVEIQTEMHDRFDRIEKQLNRTYDHLVERLDDIDFDLGQVEGSVDELQRSVYDLHGDLQRLTRNVHAFLAAGFRRELVEAINGFLNFEELTGQPIEFDDFREAENRFFSWGRDHSKDAVQAGEEKRSFADDDVSARRRAGSHEP